MQSGTSTTGSFLLHQSFSSRFEDNEPIHFVFGVPAKSGKAKDLVEADSIGRKAVADFIDSPLVENLSF